MEIICVDRYYRGFFSAVLLGIYPAADGGKGQGQQHRLQAHILEFLHLKGFTDRNLLIQGILSARRSYRDCGGAETEEIVPEKIAFRLKGTDTAVSEFGRHVVLT